MKSFISAPYVVFLAIVVPQCHIIIKASSVDNERNLDILKFIRTLKNIREFRHKVADAEDLLISLYGYPITRDILSALDYNAHRKRLGSQSKYDVSRERSFSSLGPRESPRTGSKRTDKTTLSIMSLMRLVGYPPSKLQMHNVEEKIHEEDSLSALGPRDRQRLMEAINFRPPVQSRPDVPIVDVAPVSFGGGDKSKMKRQKQCYWSIISCF